MANMKDVSKMAGVSIATVSRVINNSNNVSSEIKDKVNKAIKELGYIPNNAARSLKNDSSCSIAFVVSDISNPYFTTMAKAIEDIANEYNYNIFVCSTDDKKENELSHLKLLLSKKVDGIVINITGENNDFIEKISKDNLPMVLIDRKIESDNFIGDYISYDNYAGIQTLVTHLVSLGHTKIAVINGNFKVSTAKERYDGFVKMMKKFGILVEKDYKYRYDGDYSIESGYKATKYFMSMDEPPTAILAMNNNMAIGALKYLRTHDIKIPEEISIVSYGDIDNAELLYVRPTIVLQDPQIIGMRAGQLLMERIIKKNKLRNREVMYLPQLIIRDTTKCIGKI